MEVEGKVIAYVGENGGISKATGNPWKVKTYVLETKDQYPKKIAFEFFGERADQYPLNIGDDIRLSFDIESHEYQGRWYTRVRAWKSEALTGAAPAPAAQPQYAPPAGVPTPPPAAAMPTIEPAGSNEDLPF